MRHSTNSFAVIALAVLGVVGCDKSEPRQQPSPPAVVSPPATLPTAAPVSAPRKVASLPAPSGDHSKHPHPPTR